jgi:hypothetical protein
VLPEYTAMIFHKNHYVIVCDKIKYYADRAFRRRGIVFRRWGSGRTRGLGLGDMLLGLALLALSGVVTLFVASLPALVQRPPATASGGHFEAGHERFFAPAPYGQGMRPGVRRPLPPQQVRGRLYRSGLGGGFSQ